MKNHNNQFPKWVYHRDHPARVVKTASDFEALGAEWVESPAKVHEPFEEGDGKEVIQSVSADDLAATLEEVRRRPGRPRKEQ